MNDNAKLEEILTGYKVGELKELAKISGVTGYSKLKKAELIEVVSAQLKTVDVATLDVSDELKDALNPTVTESKENTKAKPVKSSRSNAPIVGVAPHVMNVAQNGQPPVAPISRPSGSRKIYPNEPCPCGSGLKYKKCCGRR